MYEAQYAFNMSMIMCPVVHMATRSLLRSSSTHEPSDGQKKFWITTFDLSLLFSSKDFQQNSAHFPSKISQNNSKLLRRRRRQKHKHDEEVKQRNVKDWKDSGKWIASEEDAKSNAKLIEVWVGSLYTTTHPRIEGIQHHEVGNLWFGVVGFVDADDLWSLLAHLED
jgi:hypothetical protein